MNTRVAIIGDIHGNSSWLITQLSRASELGIKEAHICGDFGFWGGSGGQHFLGMTDAALKRLDMVLYVTLGNHENYDIIDELGTDEDGLLWIRDRICIFPRPYRFNLGPYTALSLGGAPSIDFEYRIVGVSWWSQEFITAEQAFEAMDGGPVDIMITHDAPEHGTPAVQRIIDGNPMGWSDRARKYAKHGRDIMTSVVSEVQPRLLLHGHYHVADMGEMEHGGSIVAVNRDGQPRNMVILDLTEDEIAVHWYEDLVEGKV